MAMGRVIKRERDLLSFMKTYHFSCSYMYCIIFYTYTINFLLSKLCNTIKIEQNPCVKLEYSHYQYYIDEKIDII